MPTLQDIHRKMGKPSTVFGHHSHTDDYAEVIYTHKKIFDGACNLLGLCTIYEDQSFLEGFKNKIK